MTEHVYSTCVVDYTQPGIVRKRISEFVRPDWNERPRTLRQQWIDTMITVYKERFPGSQEEAYQRWAEGELNHGLFQLGDYLTP